MGFKLGLSVFISIVFISTMVAVFKVSNNNKSKNHTRLIHVDDKSQNQEVMYVPDPLKKTVDNYGEEQEGQV